MEEREDEPAPAGAPPDGRAAPEAPAPQPAACTDPTLLFEEYVQRVEDDTALDDEPYLARAGPLRAELAQLLHVWRTMEGVRAAASDGTNGALAAGMRRANTVTHGQQRFGSFEQLELIGEGGLSRVFLATDTQLRRRVALKVLKGEHIDSAGAQTWILNEGRSIARLEHPGVVRVFECGETEGVPYVAMEHVRGPNLRAVLRCLRAEAGRPETDPPPAEPAAAEAAARLRTVAARCELVAQLAEALAFCHECGVIHRDIKPANVLLADGVRPKLIDFGLAHLEAADGLTTQITQRLMGTPAYIAPEQADNRRTGASAQSDQFALGIVLVELLTLDNPFSRDTRTETLDAISRAEPPRLRELAPSLSADLERICLHALERDPARRYPRVSDFAADLRAFLEHRAISLRPPSAGMLAGLWLRRHRRRLLRLATAAVLLLLVGLGARTGMQHAARRDLEQSVQALVASLPERTVPGDFRQIYLQLGSLRDSATELDDALPGRLVFPPLRPVVQAAIEDCARRISAIFGGKLAAIDAARDLRERETRTADLLQQWRPVLLQEHEVCPECPFNRAALERGTVQLPAATADRDVRLLRLETVPGFPVAVQFEPTSDTRDLAPGMYRLIVSAAGSGGDPLDDLEQDFVLRTDEPRRAIEPRPLAPAVRAQMLPCAGGTLVLDDDPGTPAPALHVPVAPFFITSRPVTWREVGELWGSARLVALVNAYKGSWKVANKAREVPAGLVRPDDPAVLQWRVAQLYAEGVGARLPTVLEWRCAYEMPGFERPQTDPPLLGEWTSVPAFDEPSMRYRVSYGRQDEEGWNQWSSTSLEFGMPVGIAFRLARSSR